MQKILFILFFLIPCFAISQFEGSNLLPIKINQKWGLIDINGTLVMEAKYDLFGERFGAFQVAGGMLAARYVTVQLNNQLGLINLQGEEILPPIFDEIIDAFPDSIFTVKKEGQLLVVNSQGETIFDGKYDEVIPIPRNPDFFIVKENGFYGLIKKNTGYVIPSEYPYLFLKNRRFPFLKYATETSLDEHKFGLIHFDNKKILPPVFDEIQIITSNCFLTKNNGFLQIWNANGKAFISEKDQWTKSEIFNKSFISLSSPLQKKSKLFSIKSQKFITPKTSFDKFKAFDGKNLLAQKNGRWGLIDSLGNEIIPPEFSSILHLEGDSLFQVRKINWGVFNINKGLITPAIYEEIGNFNNAFAKIHIGKKVGLLNRKGEESAAVQFEYFQFQDQFVKAFYGQKMNYYEADTLDRLQLLEIFPEVYTLRIGYEEEESLANINPRRNFSGRRSLRRRRPPKKKPDYSLIENSDVEWFNDWGLWGLRKKSTAEIIIKPQYEFILRLPFTDLSVVYSFDKKIHAKALLELLTIRPKKGAFAIAFYSHQQEKFVTDFDFMGIRKEDFEYDLPYASCLDKNGKVLLISKKGQILNTNQPFDFVGRFYEGKARICINASIKKIKQPEETGYSITKSSTFQKSYGIRYNRFITGRSRDMWWIGGSWGFIDTMGRVVIPPNYEYVNDFENQTSICKKENWGVVNATNQILLNFKYKKISREKDFLKVGVKNQRPVFYNALGNAIIDWGYEKFKPFSEGYSAVKKNGTWGFVNKKGEEILPCEHLTVNSFSEGWAAIQSEMGWYFVDTSMTIVLDFRETDYLQFGNFSGGLCWYKVKINDRFFYGYIDQNGEHLINAIYTKAFDFQQGRARVVKNKKTGLIDSTGIFIMPPKKYDLVFPFDENGIAPVRESNMGAYGLINRDGKMLSPCIYNKIFTFVDGYAKVVSPKGIGFVDTLGNEVIPAKYRAVGEPSEGLVAIQHGFSYYWQYTTLNNTIAFDGKFIKAEPFKNGKAIVSIRKGEDMISFVINKKGEKIELGKNGMVLHFSEKKYGFRSLIRDLSGNISNTYCYYTDSLGTPLFNKRRFKTISPFKNNTALVQYENGKWATITGRGFVIIPNKFHRIFELPNDMFSAIAGELYGLYDADGNEVLPPIFDHIELVKFDLLQVEQGSKIGYFTMNKTWVWNPF